MIHVFCHQIAQHLQYKQHAHETTLYAARNYSDINRWPHKTSWSIHSNPLYQARAVLLITSELKDEIEKGTQCTFESSNSYKASQVYMSLYHYAILHLTVQATCSWGHIKCSKKHLWNQYVFTQYSAQCKALKLYYKEWPVNLRKNSTLSGMSCWWRFKVSSEIQFLPACKISWKSDTNAFLIIQWINLSQEAESVQKAVIRFECISDHTIDELVSRRNISWKAVIKHICISIIQIINLSWESSTLAIEQSYEWSYQFLHYNSSNGCKGFLQLDVHNAWSTEKSYFLRCRLLNFARIPRQSRWHNWIIWWWRHCILRWWRDCSILWKWRRRSSRRCTRLWI